MRKFKVGDRVRFGVDDEGWPVWSINKRFKSFMVSHTVGRVISISENVVLVEWRIGAQKREWGWPQYKKYDTNSHGYRFPAYPYGLPGYLELIDEKG
jgi:hypothetical protein